MIIAFQKKCAYDHFVSENHDQFESVNCGMNYAAMYTYRLVVFRKAAPRHYHWMSDECVAILWIAFRVIQLS